MKRYHNFLVLIIALVAIVFVSACDNSTEPDTYPPDTHAETLNENNIDTEPIYVAPIIFERTIDENHRQEFPVTAQIEDRVYFFPSDDEVANLEFVNITEQLISTIDNRFSLSYPPAMIFMTGGIEHYSFRPGIATFNQNDINTIGWLVHAWSNGRIPIWLSVGIETMARVELGLHETGTNSAVTDILNELVFSPVFWGSGKHLEAIDTAYYFVSYLHETEKLTELIELYLSQEKSTADEKALEFFANFSGGVGTGIIVNFELMRLLYPAVYSISATTEKANYMFLFRGFDEFLVISQSSLAEYIEIMDNSIAFAYNWFIDHLQYTGAEDFPFYPIDVRLNLGESTRVPWAGGYPTSRNCFVINMLDDNADDLPSHLSWVTPHEAAHIMSWRLYRNRLLETYVEPVANAMSSRVFAHRTFEEGLAMVVDRFFRRQYHPQFQLDNETHSHIAIADITILTSEVFIDKPHDMWSEYEYERLLNAAKTTAESFDNAEILQHLSAYIILNHFEMLPPWWREQVELYRRNFSMNRPLPYANCYITSASFVFFLIESYGIGMFMQAHANPNNFEEIYGINTCDMIERWKNFLSDMAEYLKAETVRNFGL